MLSTHSDIGGYTAISHPPVHHKSWRKGFAVIAGAMDRNAGRKEILSIYKMTIFLPYSQTYAYRLPM
jgi:hypothetical protein